jgi:RimJ/RimL family protein N-acetyltransferase
MESKLPKSEPLGNVVDLTMAAWPAERPAHVATAFFKAYSNGDDASMQHFETEYCAEDALKERSVAELVQSWRKYHAEWGELRARKFVVDSEDDVYVLVRAEGEAVWETFRFMLQAEKPHRLIGIEIASPTRGDERSQIRLPGYCWSFLGNEVANVVIGGLFPTRQMAGREMQHDWRFTKVYARSNEFLQVVAWHASQCPDQPPADRGENNRCTDSGLYDAGDLGRKNSMIDEITLRDVTVSDLPILFEQQMETDATYMAAFPSRDRKAFQAHWTKLVNDESILTRTIYYRGKVAGYIGTFEMHDKREIGYWIGKEYWGKGIATQALTAFLRIERRRPLYAGVAKRNGASIRVLQKCGFIIESEETEFANFDGENVEGLILKLNQAGE